jgi:hypothetical protein
MTNTLAYYITALIRGVKSCAVETYEEIGNDKKLKIRKKELFSVFWEFPRKIGNF